MNVLLLGNGFDLYHYLPTQYSNFLHTSDFLLKYYDISMKTIGDIFNDKRLQETDPYIAMCYEKHKSIYDEMPISPDTISDLKQILNDNLWFSYLLNSFDKNVGWIDFEKEISFVIENFRDFLNEAEEYFNLPTNSKIQSYIIGKFNFFANPYKSSSREFVVIGGPNNRFKEKYLIQYPQGSGNIIVNKEMIISELYSELEFLSKALKLYLTCFVDNILSNLKLSDNLEKCNALNHIDNTITFNYTNTYEKLYSNKTIFHLHGNVNKKIILGINPDKYDTLETVDTSFISFKKYFQRTMLETDNEYIKWLNEVTSESDDIILLIMGHSLDVTDKDVIEEVFSKAKEIYILYHSIESKFSYISNLIKIFGREKFEKIKKTQNLTFLSLESDFNDLSEKLKGNKVIDDFSAYQICVTNY